MFWAFAPAGWTPTARRDLDSHSRSYIGWNGLQLRSLSLTAGTGNVLGWVACVARGQPLRLNIPGRRCSYLLAVHSCSGLCEQERSWNSPCSRSAFLSNDWAQSQRRNKPGNVTVHMHTWLTFSYWNIFTWLCLVYLFILCSIFCFFNWPHSFAIHNFPLD